jgi:hypothetical protein
MAVRLVITVSLALAPRDKDYGLRRVVGARTRDEPPLTAVIPRRTFLGTAFGIVESWPERPAGRARQWRCSNG